MTEARELPRTLEDGRQYISPSQARAVLSCPARYEWSYLLGNRHPESDALHMGSCVHELVEAWARSEAQGTSVADPLKMALQYAEEEVPEGLIEDVKAFAGEAVALAQLAIEHIQNREWTVLDTEKRVVMDKGEYSVLCYPDLVVEDKDGRVLVVDLKTSKRSPSNGVASEDHSFQVVQYVAGRRSVGEAADGGVVLYLVRNKTPKLVECEVVVSPEAIDWASAVVDGAVRLIRSGRFDPNPFGAGWLCASDKCGRWSTCPGAARWREGGDA